MSKVDAMNYEYLVRRAHQCGRYGNKGADADVYRRLERARGHFISESERARLGQPKGWNKPVDELERDYKKNLQEVAGYVDKAIGQALKKFRGALSDEQQTDLTTLQSQLSDPTFEELEEVIDQAEKIMVEAKIFPG